MAQVRPPQATRPVGSGPLRSEPDWCFTQTLDLTRFRLPAPWGHGLGESQGLREPKSPFDCHFITALENPLPGALPCGSWWTVVTRCLRLADFTEAGSEPWRR